MQRGYTPLHRASKYGRSEVVSTLLFAGAEKDATDSVSLILMSH